MVFSAADGAIYAIQPRTGKTIWKYQASTRGINSTPVVDENGIVYAGHAEQNSSDTTILGAVFAFDGNTTGEITEDKLLWKAPKRALGRSSLVKLGNRIYFLEDNAQLVILDAATGESVGQKKLGRIMFGSPMVADGKLYIAENTGRFYVLKPTDTGVEVVSEARLGQGEEVFGSPAASNGRIFLPSIEALYCIGSAESSAGSKSGVKPAITREQKITDRTITQMVLSPTEVLLQPGQKLQLTVHGYNAAGQLVGPVKNAAITAEGGGTVSGSVYTAPATGVAGVTLTAKAGEMSAKSRLRVVPQLPWKFDFADEKVPPVWIGADYRHKPAPLDGEKGLVKVSTIPKGTRSQAWMGWTDLHDYTIQADFKATEKGGRLPDMGLINQRYTLDLQGASRLEIRSWTARRELRFAKTIDFTWKANTWYTMKFQSQTAPTGVTLRGKVWPRGEKEPAAWQIEATDATPNLNGSPGLFGNATDAEFFIDNVSVSANR
jgi:hypothetical protein